MWLLVFRVAMSLLCTVSDFLKPNSITLASSELAPNMFGASSELASVMEFGFYLPQLRGDVTLNAALSESHVR